MAKPNYAFDKRQRELAKKKKKEEKQQLKAAAEALPVSEEEVKAPELDEKPVA